ncbi:flagellar hook-associated protein FlgL [Demequina sp. TTPB684]|uniref:flagellar hook-associated protein FlgL n=1 Tax=unclassified Demequina TaxID=2620311 RepID=UPI001CF4E9CD|nr:flagellar hook-associated protein FlgL [Demequina sp. TMPB413]MCB2411961.1 flagellar hook-associated protein FlgL [Demequina sp. TTPB684]UPU87907.1 flagellar hook-associated protein FlgL [Demequina sp. TMPB413]
MINRVTQQTMQRSTLYNLQNNMATMSKLQARMSSGKAIQRPSDDPSSTGRTMTFRAEKAAATQASRNTADGVAWLATIDNTMQSSISALQRVRDLTVQGANSGSVGPTSRGAIATEIEGLRDTLLDLANTNFQGRSVFAGTSNAGVAFEDGTAATPYAWNGVAGSSVERRIGPDATVRVDADGAATYGTGATSVFQLLDDIAADLRGTAEVSGRLAEIDTRLNGMLAQIADVGIRYKQVSDAQQSIAKTLQDVTSSIDDVEGIDLAETIMELKMQEVAYQGALGATARVLQPTLMDFLR